MTLWKKDRTSDDIGIMNIIIMTSLFEEYDEVGYLNLRNNVKQNPTEDGRWRSCSDSLGTRLWCVSLFSDGYHLLTPTQIRRGD